MSDFIIKVVGLNLLQKRMMARKMKLTGGQRGGVSRKANAQAIAIVDRWVQKNFEGEGKLAMGGGGWKPLSAATLLARAEGWGQYVKSKTPKILQNKGALKSRWKHFYNSNTGKLQSQVDYGVAHDEGKGSLPTRRILPLDRQIKPKLNAHYQWFIRQSIR